MGISNINECYHDQPPNMEHFSHCILLIVHKQIADGISACNGVTNALSIE